MSFFVAAWSYALCVNFVPTYRDPADKFHVTKIGIERARDEENLQQEVSRIHEKGSEGEAEAERKEIGGEKL
jgi:FHS family L-fucose permease-like MFS transporter